MMNSLSLFFVSLGMSLAVPALCEPMTAAEFDAYSKGKTLFFGSSDTPYGAEVYFEDRRVRWSFLDGECQDGVWYEEAGDICFVYENHPEPQCWQFERNGAGLIARFRGASASVILYEARDVDEEMVCLGPKVGV